MQRYIHLYPFNLLHSTSVCFALLLWIILCNIIREISFWNLHTQQTNLIKTYFTLGIDLYRISHPEIAEPGVAPARFRLWPVLSRRFHWRSLLTSVPGIHKIILHFHLFVFSSCCCFTCSALQFLLRLLYIVWTVEHWCAHNQAT